MTDGDVSKQDHIRWAADALVDEHGVRGAINEIQRRIADDGLDAERAYTAIGYIQDEHLEADPEADVAG
ncbi:MAG: hypothetical protein ABEI76_08585 [Halobacteriales archaeon]